MNKQMTLNDKVTARTDWLWQTQQESTGTDKFKSLSEEVKEAYKAGLRRGWGEAINTLELHSFI